MWHLTMRLASARSRSVFATSASELDLCVDGSALVRRVRLAPPLTYSGLRAIVLDDQNGWLSRGPVVGSTPSGVGRGFQYIPY